ncbi:MAG: AAA family ATPase [Thermomicrobiales bacterium]
MILASVEIENYKQYGDAHQIDFPEQGMIAITGPNGAGKTTLFEAIEWCLYGPRTIPLAAIPPHGGIGHTRVRVTVQDPHDGRRYTVQRSLRNGLTSAEAYAEEDPGQPLVQGPRDVTDYVAKQLVGLPHGAFVSTFFTRQKELTFFGDRSPTERRVEVARLLGFQTIRDAQEEIAQERQVARSSAVSLNAQYERDAAGRDFAAEIAAAETAVAEVQALASTSHDRLTDADAAYARAREALERWRGLQERDTACERELLTIAGAAQAATSRRHAADAELSRLQALADERTALAGHAAKIDELLVVVTACETERDRARRLETFQQNRRVSTEQLATAALAVARIVSGYGEAAAGLAGWFWDEGDDADPCRATRRLLEAIGSVDHREIRQHAALLQRAFDTTTRINEAAANLDRYRAFRDKLSGQRDSLRKSGDPEARLRQAETDLADAQSLLEAAVASLTEARREREESEELEKILDERTFDRICPVCTRPLNDDEAARLLRSLRGSTKRLKDEEATRELQVRDARAQVATAELARSGVANDVQTDSVLQERLADGERMIAEVEAEQARHRAELFETLAAAGLDSPPGLPDVEAARIAMERATELAPLAGTLEQLGQRAAAARDVVTETDREIGTLGTVCYDAAAHQEAQRALESARHAAADISRIDKELRAKSTYDAARAEAARELVELALQSQTVEAARAEIGFDADTLQRARAAEVDAGVAQQRAREDAAQARDALREAQLTLQRVVDEQKRLSQLAEEATRCGREADELDRMYREFAEFDKFVADHVGPLLAETTERLLSLVTHGKYDRVRFDENYGIEVFDGDECFKLDGFSGGERDVVALCARLAMSELVGSSALRPPRFLVLDEVFGSLDSERRTQLLETLGSLASSGHFQQMFIISHVDDVQQSPLMNEAWTIEERGGVSHVIRPELFAVSLA